MFSWVKIDKRPYHEKARDLIYKNAIYTYLWKLLRKKVTNQNSPNGQKNFGRFQQRFNFLSILHQFLAKTAKKKVVDESASNILELLQA